MRISLPVDIDQRRYTFQKSSVEEWQQSDNLEDWRAISARAASPLTTCILVPVETDMNPATSGFANMMLQMMVLPRSGSGAEVASWVAYLAGSEAGYATGGNLAIDGGFSR
jgi:NAD(P)-dependent dehydrogenase (short-subunit alcohol dehydrogenase family)